MEAASPRAKECKGCWKQGGEKSRAGGRVFFFRWAATLPIRGVAHEGHHGLCNGPLVHTHFSKGPGWERRKRRIRRVGHCGAARPKSVALPHSRGTGRSARDSGRHSQVLRGAGACCGRQLFGGSQWQHSAVLPRERSEGRRIGRSSSSGPTRRVARSAARVPSKFRAGEEEMTELRVKMVDMRSSLLGGEPEKVARVLRGLQKNTNEPNQQAEPRNRSRAHPRWRTRRRRGRVGGQSA